MPWCYLLLLLNISCPRKENLKSVKIGSLTKNAVFFPSVLYTLISLPNDTCQYIIKDLKIKTIREITVLLQEILANLQMTHFKCGNP